MYNLCMTTKGPWKVLNTREIYKNQWLTVDEDKVITPKGTPGVHILLHIGGGVNIVPLDNEGNVCLAREYQYAVGQETIGCVSGKREENEDPLISAKRELKEELGIEAEEWVNLGTTISTPQYIDALNYQFLATKLKFGGSSQEDSEKVSLFKVPFEDAVKMVLDGRIIHASSCVTILRAQAYLRDKSNS